MTLSILLILNAVLSLFRGIGFIFTPAKLWAPFKVTIDNTDLRTKKVFKKKLEHIK